VRPPDHIVGPLDLDDDTRHQHGEVPRHGRQGPAPTLRSNRLPLLPSTPFPRNEGMPATPLPSLTQNAEGDIAASSFQPEITRQSDDSELLTDGRRRTPSTRLSGTKNR
jgi:hypothetical protein